MNNKENVDSTGPPSQLDDECSASGQLRLGKRKHEEPSSGRVAKEHLGIREIREVWFERCQEYHRELVDKGTTREEYAKSKGFSYSTFRNWWPKYRKEKGLLPTQSLRGFRPTVAMSQQERNGNTDDMKTKATTQNTRNGDGDSDRRQVKPQAPPPLPPPQPAGTVRRNPQPVEAHASIPPAAAVAIKTDPTYRHFHVDIDGEVESQRFVRLQESCNDTLTFHDLRHAIRDQLSWGENISFQFIVGRYLLYPRQETWNVKEYIRVDSEADGSFWKPYQVTIKVLPPHEPQPDSVGSIVDV